MKKRVSTCVFVLCYYFLCSFAQTESTGIIRQLAENGYRITLRAGYNIGGCAPMPMPQEIKSINGYNPGFNMGIGADIEKMFNDRWGVMSGIRFESKSMDADATVENYHTVLSRNGDLVEGNFTGKESTSTERTLITVPIRLLYRPSRIWTLQAGPYISYALKKEFSGKATEGYIRTLNNDPITGLPAPIGNRIDITPDNPATYDFSEKMRRLEWGVSIDVDCQCFKQLMVYANIDWGMSDIFRNSFDDTISFPMYSIYATIGFGYTF